MQHSDAKEEEKHDHQELSGLDRERRKLRRMRVFFAVFSAALLLFLVISLLLNR